MHKDRILLLSLAIVLIVVTVGTWLFFGDRYRFLLDEIRTLQTSMQPTPEAAAEPFTVAFVSDTETLSRWDEILGLIRDEGAEILAHQGDYLSGLNPQTLEPSTYADLMSEEILDAGGQPTGQFNCDRTLKGIRCILGPDFPVLGAPIGKSLPEELETYFLQNLTRLEEQGATWGGCVSDGAMGEPGVRMEGCGTDDNLANSRAGDYWVRYKGVSLVFQNGQPDTRWVPQALEDDPNVWKVCLWHGNHFDFQVGVKGHGYDGKDHSLPYMMYQNCADAGALVVNGNEHGYSRTCVMDNIGNYQNGGPSFPNRVNRQPGTELEGQGANCSFAGTPNAEAVDAIDQVELGPGKTMVMVSSLPGYAWRAYESSVESLIEQDTYRHDNDGWWATVFSLNRYCRNNCTKADLSGQNPDAFVPGMNPPQKTEEPPEAPWDPYSDGHGVLFITFNYEGDPLKAHGYFKKLTPDPDTGRQIVDEFVMTYAP